MNTQKKNEDEKTHIFSKADYAILSSYEGLLPAFQSVMGKSCLVVLRSAHEPSFPCIAVLNGEINGNSVGDSAPNFIIDAIRDENKTGQKDLIGPYITKTEKGHSINCAVYIIRNSEKEIIGCLCMGVDVSMPLDEFVESFMPKIDYGLAESISERKHSELSDIDGLIESRIQIALESANLFGDISATEKNRRIVQQLKADNVFSIRGAVNIVAGALGVSRYTIYNYLKDIYQG